MDEQEQTGKLRLEPDRCPGRNATNGQHKWSIMQSQYYGEAHYVRETGIRCVWCDVTYTEPEDDVIAYFAKRRAAWRRKAWRNTQALNAAERAQ